MSDIAHIAVGITLIGFLMGSCSVDAYDLSDRMNAHISYRSYICDEITPDFIQGVISGVSSANVEQNNNLLIGAISKNLDDTGIWYDSSDLSQLNPLNSQDIVFIIFDADSVTSPVIGLQYSNGYCTPLLPTLASTGHIDDVVFEILGILDENIDGF